MASFPFRPNRPAPETATDAALSAGSTPAGHTPVGSTPAPPGPRRPTNDSAPAPDPKGVGRWMPDITASIVVFLVALPLCVGIAVASGVPAELGIITGIVGGIVAGLLPGSSLQVSGPAAGLTVLCLDLVTEHGIGALGAVVLAAGLLQILFGVIRIGKWFQAISTSVVHGMLAGIGLVLVLQQLYPAADAEQQGSALENLLGLPALLTGVFGSTGVAAVGVAVMTLVVLFTWKKLPGPAHWIPAPLAGVLVAIAVTVAFDLPVQRLEVGTLLEAIQPPGLTDLGGLVNGTLIGTAIVFALIASAESLFSAAAVDRMHTGAPTRYNKELIAQGAGNTVCGLLGALPMTAVIVRSVTNVEAGARTKVSRVLHGVWLLLFVVAVPQALSYIPIAALAALLLQAGWKLMSPATLAPLWRDKRGEFVIVVVTALAIAATTLFEGVIIGIVLALAKTAWELSNLHVDVEEHGEHRVKVKLRGYATFLRVPRINETLEQLPDSKEVEVDAAELDHFDDASREAVEGWARRAEETGTKVVIQHPPS